MDSEGGLWSCVGECVSYVGCEYFTVHIVGMSTSILPCQKGWCAQCELCGWYIVGGLLISRLGDFFSDVVTINYYLTSS